MAMGPRGQAMLPRDTPGKDPAHPASGGCGIPGLLAVASSPASAFIPAPPSLRLSSLLCLIRTLGFGLNSAQQDDFTMNSLTALSAQILVPNVQRPHGVSGGHSFVNLARQSTVVLNLLSDV